MFVYILRLEWDLKGKKNQIRKFPDKGENALWGIISRYSYTNTNTNILLAQTQLQ